MNAAIYARYSTDLQREASIEDQVRECRRTAVSNNLAVVACFNDKGISGGVTERPGYQAMLAAARRGEFSVIIVEDISRLWRARAEYGRASAELEDINVNVLSNTGDDTRRDGYGLVLGIKSAIAEHQRREISYRTRRGLEGLAAAGKSTGGRCFGYGSPAEADTVRRVFAERVAGLELRAILAGLHRDGTPAPRGPRWSYVAVKRILRNERYTGRIIWGATQSKTRAQDGRRAAPLRRPEPLVVRYDPAQRLITKEQFDAAQNPRV